MLLKYYLSFYMFGIMQPKRCYHFVPTQFGHIHVKRLTEVNEV